MLVFVVMFAIMIEACSKEPRSVTEQEVRSAMASHLGAPGYTGEDFAKRLFGVDVKVELYHVSEQNMYFSMPAQALVPGALEKLTVNPTTIQWGKVGQSDEGYGRVPQLGRQILGDYGLDTRSRYLFRIAVGDLRLDKDQKIIYQFGNVTYDITPTELTRFLSNELIYTGFYKVMTDGLITINRAIMVAKPGEPSLTRLVRRITAQTRSAEENIQALLDFIIPNIRYNKRDNVTDRAILKRPDEVLMIQGGNCANKTILFASLLEQMGADYLILYMPKAKHATIAVAGKFPNANHLSFEFEGKTYFWAEPTIDTRFVIGKTVLEGMTAKNIEFVQRAGGRLYSMREKKYLPFVGE